MKVINIPNGMYPERDIILSISKRLKNEQVGILPTDTIYGFHCKFDSEKCISRIDTLKRKNSDRKYLMLIDGFSFFEKFGINLSNKVRALCEIYWPGQLTLLFKSNENFPPWCVSPDGKIGVRMPGLPFLMDIIKECGFPLISTSVNVTGNNPLTNVEEIIEKFADGVDFIVDFGNLEMTTPSTVIDVSSEKFLVVREGAIPTSVLKSFLEE